MSAQAKPEGFSDEDLAHLRMSADADRNHALVKELLHQSIDSQRGVIAEHPEYSSLTAAGTLALRFLVGGYNAFQLAALLGVAIDRLARLPETNEKKD